MEGNHENIYIISIVIKTKFKQSKQETLMDILDRVKGLDDYEVVEGQIK